MNANQVKNALSQFPTRPHPSAAGFRLVGSMEFHIHHHYHHEPALKTIIRQQEALMADQKVLDAKLDELAAADAARHAAIQDELAQLSAAVAATAPDLAPQVAKIQAMIDAASTDTAALKADDPAPTPTP